jgi:hypothetical protein
MSSSNNNQTGGGRTLLEENQTLTVLVGQLQEELRQKDVLIATLESQISALVLANRRTTPRTDGDQEDESETMGYDDGDTLSRISSLGLGSITPRTEPQHRQWGTHLPPKPVPTGRSTALPTDTYNTVKGLNQWNSDDESVSPHKQKPTITADSHFGGIGTGLPPPYPPTLRPPSRGNVEVKNATTTPKASSKGSNGKKNGTKTSTSDNSNNNGNHHQGTNGHNGTTATSNTDYDHDENQPDGYNNNSNNNPSSSTQDAGRKTMLSGKGAIKALPRELSIYNNDDDDVTKYSVDDGQPNYDVQKIEFRDAYNCRGIYTGSVQRAEQMPHGYGKMKYHVGGRYYEGDWHLGHWHGHGIIRNAEGDVYEGQVVNDLKQGDGRMTYADGRIFLGTFQENEAVDGTIIFPDGAKYVGSLHKGARHGYGVYYFTDGSKYEGQSVMNVFEGTGKMTWNDGGWYEGEFSQGEIHGFGKEIRADKSLRHDGRWSKGVPIRI